MFPPPPGATPAMFRAALAAAAHSPLGANPRVGAVVLSRTGEHIATGHHRGAGTPHAEAEALTLALRSRKNARGGTCIVTLEPCAHDGRTPSCARSLIRDGVSTVIYAVDDPNPVAAGGAKLLREAGVTVHRWSDVVEASVGRALTMEARELNRRWFRARAEARPFVTAKTALTLDGRVAAADGTSQWITGPEARQEGHQMRAHVDAIAVGTGTLLTDDPALTARKADSGLAPTQPLRVVIGERAIPVDAKVFGPGGRTRVYRTHDVRAVMTDLAATEGVEHLLIEGGPTLVSAALKADVVDDLWLHVAPTVLGSGTPAFAPMGITTLGERVDFDLVPPVHMVGGDLLCHAIPKDRPLTEG